MDAPSSTGSCEGPTHEDHASSPSLRRWPKGSLDLMTRSSTSSNFTVLEIDLFFTTIISSLAALAWWVWAAFFKGARSEQAGRQGNALPMRACQPLPLEAGRVPPSKQRPSAA